MRTTFRAPFTALLALALAAVLAVVAAGPPGAAAAPTNSPIGHLDAVQGRPGGIDVRGWALDPDTTAPIYVWVTLDGVGRHVYADQPRPDVAAVHPFYGPNHGFATTLAASPGTHTVCATAHNVGQGAHQPLGCRTVQVLAAGTPIGNFEGATGVVGGVEVSGWALDPDTTGSVYVWVTVDGVGRHLYANQPRPDVGAAYPGYGSEHGFRGTVTASPGLHTVCVTVSNVGPGAHRLLGCRYVVAGSTVCPPFGTTGTQGSAVSPGLQLSTIYGSTIRTGRHSCYDRVVLEFAGAGTQPGWRASLVPVIVGDASGLPADPPLRGSAFIDVAFGAWITGVPLGQPALSPSQVLPSGYPALREVRSVSAFEGVSQLGIGLDAPRPYRVTWLESPWRLVVDVYTAVP